MLHRLALLCIMLSTSILSAQSAQTDHIEPAAVNNQGTSGEVGEFTIAHVIPLTTYQLKALREIVASDSEAAALAAQATREAAALLDDQPTPLEVIHYAGLVNTDPRRIASVAKLRDMSDIATLMRYWQISGDEKAAATLRRFIWAWVKTYKITGNDVNENKFWPLLVAIDALGKSFDDTQKSYINNWVQKLGELHLAAITEKKPLGNRYSKHVRLTAMAGRILGRDKWIAAARESVQRFVEQSLFADGTSMDLKRRDTLTYHASGLRPMVELAILSGPSGEQLYSWQSADGASLKKSVEYLVPYATGEKTRREWVNSQISLDKRRAQAGIDHYQPGKLYNPESSLELMELASAFDSQLLGVVQQLTKSQAKRYPTFQTLINSVATLSADALDPRVIETVAALDREFDETFGWWARVYDSKSGGCYYCLSAKRLAPENKKFGPDIEATSKLVHVLDWTGLLADSPAAFKQGVINYMQQRQDPDSGFFRDPQHIESYTPNTLDRAAGMANNSIRDCGGEPLYKLPLERRSENAEAAAHYAHLESADSLRKWLDELPWETRTWTTGARLRAQSGIFQQLDEPKRSELLAVIDQYVRNKQRPNGFFGPGKDDWTSQLSGSYKIASFMDQNGLEVPRAQQMAETVLKHLYNSDYRNSIVLYNTANILNTLHSCGCDFDLDQRIAIVRRCTQILHKMRAPDGGFVTSIDHTSPYANGKLLGADVVESNTNATGLAHKTRKLLIKLLTGRDGPHSHPRGKDFLNALQK